MFTQKCFILKNSQELRNKVYRLGNRNGTWLNDASDILSANETLFKCWDSDLGAEYILTKNGYINCMENEELFLAIAALRDNSDKFQYFTNGVFWLKCSQLELKHELDNNYEEFCVADFHKATVSELIEHFKK